MTRSYGAPPRYPSAPSPTASSALDGRLIRLPLYCGKHEAYYPAVLAQRTLRTGQHYVFPSGCECPYCYIIRTEADGAHMKRWGEPTAIQAAYEDWPGEEFVIEDDTARSSSRRRSSDPRPHTGSGRRAVTERPWLAGVIAPGRHALSRLMQLLALRRQSLGIGALWAVRRRDAAVSAR